MERIDEKLKQNKVITVDGAWGTMLQQAGLKSGECPEAWNLHHQEAVLTIAHEYAILGVDILETNSFGGTRIKLKDFGLENKTLEINKRAAELSSQAALPGQIVMGSMGPTGKLLMMGEVSGEEVYDSFSEQARGLEAGGAAAVVIETMTDLDEALLAIKAVQENTNLEIVASFTFNHTGAGEYRTLMGQTSEQVIGAVLDQGVKIAGTNCGFGLKEMIPLVKEIHTVFPQLPVFANANAGLPVIENGLVKYPDTPGVMSGMMPELMEAGARIIGGCCGTTPEHIKEMMKRLKAKG